MSNSKKYIKNIVMVGVLSAISFVLFLFPKFPILSAFPWLDIDFSDVPALFASVAVSPLAGVCIVLIKNIIHLPVSSTGMVGEISNFLIGAMFVLSVGLAHKYIFKKLGNLTKIIASVIFGCAMQIISACLVNYFIMIPLYSAFVNFNELGGKIYYIYAGVIPFNLIKDVFCSTVFIILYKFVFKKISQINHK